MSDVNEDKTDSAPVAREESKNDVDASSTENADEIQESAHPTTSSDTNIKRKRGDDVEESKADSDPQDETSPQQSSTEAVHKKQRTNGAKSSGEQSSKNKVSTTPAAPASQKINHNTNYKPARPPNSHSGGTIPGQSTLILELAPDKVGQVIGSKGMIIQDIQIRSGAKAFVNQDFPPGVNRQVQITGQEHQVKHAADLIRMIIEQGPAAIHASPMPSGPSTTSVIECTQPQVGKIIGTGGATVKELQSKSGARIQIDQDFPPDQPRRIHISGSAPAVALATQLVTNVMMGDPTSGPIGGPSGGGMGGGSFYGSNYGSGGGGMSQEGPGPITYNPDGSAQQIIGVPKMIVGKIIGRGGENITNLQRKSGAKINVDQKVPEGVPNRVVISGNPQAIGAAAQMIQDLIMNTSRSGGGGPPMGMYGTQHNYGMGSYGGMQQQYNYNGYNQSNMPPQQQQSRHYHQHGQSYGNYGSYSNSMGGYNSHSQSHPQPPHHSKPSIWTEHKTDDGITYWYNTKTGVSQWERPNM